MKLILTNDDGIGAPGLEALYRAARSFGEPVVFAPHEPLSGCSHRVTTGGPIRVERRAAGRFAVYGTPCDCVRVALHRMPGEEVVVLSGVNDGSNLGVDVWHSGTVAAVREAAIHGRPGVAFSHYRHPGVETGWERAARLIVPLLEEFLAGPPPSPAFWNVNLPSLAADATDPQIVHCPLDPSPLPLGFRADGDDALHYNGVYRDRLRQPGKDVEVCFSGNIAVTRIDL